MLGIIIGVGAVITMIAVGASAQARVEEQIKSLRSNPIMITPGSMRSSGVRLGTGANLNLTEDDAAAIVRKVPEVQVAAPFNRGNSQIIAGNSNWATQVYGVYPDYFEARNWPLLSGPMFDPAELSGSAKVALIGQTVATQLFGDMDPVGQSMRIRNVPFTNIGVLGRKAQSMLDQDQDGVIMAPLTSARNRLFGNTQGRLRRVWTIQVKVREGANMKEAEEKIRELLRQRKRTQPGQDDPIAIRNLTEILQAQEESSRIMTLCSPQAHRCRCWSAASAS